MQTTTVTAMRATSAPAVRMRIRAGWTVSALAGLFLLFDGAIKALQLPAAVNASAQLGYGASAALGLGLIEVACLALYLRPRTAPLGALLLTGYLGGAVATHVRIGSPVFSVVFPIVLGALLWGGLALRDSRVRAFLPD